MSSYAKARFSRIYTVLIPALIFGYVLDYIGLNWCNSSELYTNSSIYKTISLNYSINSSLNLLTFIGNIFMTQEILVSHLGSNGPLWSLAYEWWYYCIFALISAALLNSGITRVVYGILGLALLLILPGKLILWGSIWLVGVVSAILIAKFNMPAHPILIFTAFLVVIIVARFSHSMDIFRVSPLISWFARDFFFSIFFAFTLFAANQIKKELPFSRINHSLAEFSFSIYLYHFPFLIFVTALTYQHFGIHFQLQPAFGSYLYCVALTSFIYLYCYLCYSITERYTPYIRLRLDSWTAKLVNSVRSRLVG
jgi:peptidoglycan/LPS O-acetylase OafA/YrhL